MNTYDAMQHSHVALEGVAFDNRPLPIVHTTGSGEKLRIWVEVSYADTLPEGALPVGDGTCEGYSELGQRIISVPAAMCVFLTDDHAEQMEIMARIDADLLAAAR